MTTSESSWRYIIVIACGGAMFFSPSIIYAHGIMLVAYTETGLYQVNTVTWLLSFANSMYAIGVLLGGILVKTFSCRKTLFVAGVAGFLGFVISSCDTDIWILFLSYGILTGLSRGVTLSAATVSVTCWFKQDNSVAFGLAYAGVGIAMFVHPRLFRAFVDIYDVHDAMLLTGAISFHTCICGLLTRPSAYELEQKRLQKDHKLRSSDSWLKRTGRSLLNFKKSILTNWSFMWFVLGVSFFLMAFMTVMTFMPAYFQSKGATPQESAMAVSIGGIGGLLSRLLAGMAANDPKIGPVLLFEGNCGISAILTFLIPFLAESTIGRYFYAAAFGTYLSCLFGILAPTTFQKVGLENLPQAYGFIYSSNAIVYLLGSPLAVYLKNAADSFYAVFMFAASLLVGSCICALISEMFKENTSDEKPPRKVDEECELETQSSEESVMKLEHDTYSNVEAS